MKLQISEILSKLKDITGEGAVAKKAEWLRKNDSPTLRMLLEHNFNPAIAYNLPEGDPPFKRNDAPDVDLSETTLYAETRKISYLWVAPSNTALNSLTKTQKQQLSELDTIQEAKNKELQEKILEYRKAEQEIEDAREAIEVARKRLSTAIDTSKRIMLEGQTLTREVEQLAAQAAAAVNTVTTVNDELLNRKTAPANRTVPKYKLEMQFVELLESLHGNEADVLLAVKNKTLQKKYAINKDVVKKAFPDLSVN